MEQEEENAKRRNKEYQLQVLQQQAQEQAMHRQIMQQDKFGKIEGGFYAKFGKSCR
jgi:hypothetical protein